MMPVPTAYCEIRTGFNGHFCSNPDHCSCACHLKHDRVEDPNEADGKPADRVVHVEIAFAVHATVTQAEEAGRKVVHDTEVRLHREVSSDVWVSGPMPEG